MAAKKKAAKKSSRKKDSALVSRSKANPVRSGVHPESTAGRLTSKLHKSDARAVRNDWETTGGSLMSTPLTKSFEKRVSRPGTYQTEPGGKLKQTEEGKREERRERAAKEAARVKKMRAKRRAEKR